MLSGFTSFWFFAQASPGSAAAEEIKSTIAETAQNTPVVASSQIAEEVKLPKEAVRGFSRANLQVRSQAEALEGGKGGALVVLPDTVKDDNHISCSPAMSEVNDRPRVCYLSSLAQNVN